MVVIGVIAEMWLVIRVIAEFCLNFAEILLKFAEILLPRTQGLGVVARGWLVIRVITEILPNLCAGDFSCVGGPDRPLLETTTRYRCGRGRRRPP